MRNKKSSYCERYLNSVGTEGRGSRCTQQGHTPKHQVLKNRIRRAHGERSGEQIVGDEAGRTGIWMGRPPEGWRTNAAEPEPGVAGAPFTKVLRPLKGAMGGVLIPGVAPAYCRTRAQPPATRCHPYGMDLIVDKTSGYVRRNRGIHK